MSNDGLYQFPDFMQAAFQDVHSWLDHREDTEGFRTEPTNIDATEPRGIGKLFHEFFPTHYFKVASSLKEIITFEELYSWIAVSGKLCALDVGCGTGIASCALIDTIADIITDYDIKQAVHVHIVGVDPNKAALEVYRALLHRISKNGPIPENLEITFEIICEKILDGALAVQSTLQSLRQKWDQPSIPRTLLMQVNVLRPFAHQISDVAKAYHQIFTSTPMDSIHCLTIGTRGWENKIQNMKNFIERHFASHTIDSQRVNTELRFVNPSGSLYRRRRRKSHTINFHATYSTIQSAEWHNDETWLKIIEPGNIELAWARARMTLLRDSLVDEAEIRLFDHNVTRFIGRLQRRLAVYAEDIFHPQEQIHYELPKNTETFRPKNLSRFEEEILSVAMIQVAGDDFLKDRRIYAFRLNHADYRKSEYLYQYFGGGYESWIEEAHSAAKSLADGVVIRTDLSSYYTHIHQTRLAGTIETEMRAESKRVKWLLRKIFHKHLDPNYHNPGYGLAQGGVGSGYYANVYLADLDNYFLCENPLGVSYHRYADDILIVVPEKESVEEVEQKLDKLLLNLELERKQEKTQVFKCSEFEDHINSGLSPELKELSLMFNITLKPLWLAACHYHTQLNIDEESLYDFLRHFCESLQTLGIVVPVPMLRRKLKKYLERGEHSLNVQLPSYDGQSDTSDWATSFRELNSDWISKVDSLRDQFVKIATEILQSLENNSDEISRDDSTRLRFCLNRLCRIGFNDQVLELLQRLLKRAPHLLREPAFVMDSLGIQGHEQIIDNLHQHFSHVDSDGKYMLAMSLRAMRHSKSVSEDILVDTVTNEREQIDARLMASETLLATQTRELDHQNWAKINNTLSNERRYPQLKKNLILLLRQVRDADESTYKPQPNDDSILRDAFEIEDGYSVFEQAEPPELEDYYDVNFPDDAFEYGEQVTVKSY